MYWQQYIEGSTWFLNTREQGRTIEVAVWKIIFVQGLWRIYCLEDGEHCDVSYTNMLTVRTWWHCLNPLLRQDKNNEITECSTSYYSTSTHKAGCRNLPFSQRALWGTSGVGSKAGLDVSMLSFVIPWTWMLFSEWKGQGNYMRAEGRAELTPSSTWNQYLYTTLQRFGENTCLCSLK